MVEHRIDRIVGLVKCVLQKLRGLVPSPVEGVVRDIGKIAGSIADLLKDLDGLILWQAAGGVKGTANSIDRVLGLLQVGGDLLGGLEVVRDPACYAVQASYYQVIDGLQHSCCSIGVEVVASQDNGGTTIWQREDCVESLTGICCAKACVLQGLRKQARP